MSLGPGWGSGGLLWTAAAGMLCSASSPGEALSSVGSGYNQRSVCLECTSIRIISRIKLLEGAFTLTLGVSIHMKTMNREGLI